MVIHGMALLAKALLLLKCLLTSSPVLINGLFASSSILIFLFFVFCFCRKVSGRGLSGSLGYQLGNLKSLTYL